MKTRCVIAMTLLGLATVRHACADAMPRLHLDWDALTALHPSWGSADAHRKAKIALDVLRSRAVAHGATWLALRPSVAVVLRDWDGATRLAGAHLCVTDATRPARSTRLVLARVALAEGRVVPFVQAGVGQWRFDPEMIAAMPRDPDFAGQVGAGIDVTIAPRVGVALETDWTGLYRDATEAQSAPRPRVLSSFAVARVEL